MPDYRYRQKLLLLACLLAANSAAQPVGRFVTTGSMQGARYSHTATPLKNGLVLIAGGLSAPNPSLDRKLELASAELYDPVTGTFATGDMAFARAFHAAALLPDGRVLIFGGRAGRDDVPAVEVYNPGTGTFSTIGNAAKSYPLATVFPDGRVLFTDRFLDGEAILFNPATASFSNVGNVASGDVAALNDGRLAVAGPLEISLYELEGDALARLATTPVDTDYEKSATVLANGQVLIAGGETDYGELTSEKAWIYDPQHSAALRSTGNLLISRAAHTATVLPGGRVLIAGGYSSGGYSEGALGLADAEQYDPANSTFTNAGKSSWIHYGNTATLLPDGTVLIAGGNSLSTAELYIPAPRAASAASFSGPLAIGSIGSIFGARLASTTASADPLGPSTALGGIRLRVRDSSGSEQFAPLFYVSPSQINFELPVGIPPGDVTLEVLNAPGEDFHAAAQTVNVAPGIFTLENDIAAGYGLRVEPDGSRTVLDVRNTITLDDRPVYLTVYATGLGNRSSLENVHATVGGIPVPVEYAGPSGDGIPGLDQVNIRLIPELQGLGLAGLALNADSIFANTVRIRIE